METDDRPVKAKRRVTTTVVPRAEADAASTGFRPENANAHNIFSSNEVDDAELDTVKSPTTVKKRARPSSELYAPFSHLPIFIAATTF